MTTPRADRARRTWPQRMILALGGLVVLAGIGAALGVTYASSKAGELNRVALGPVLSDESAAGEPVNFLLVGTDNASRLEADDVIRQQRSDANLLTDTMIVFRVDPTTSQAAILSIPRDLFLPIVGAGYSARVNSALSIGGAETLLSTISEGLDVPIHHYVQIDFRAFLDVVDAVGGVPVHLEYPIKDDRVGLYVPDPGCQTLDAGTALAYVRSRNLEQWIDEQWVILDARADLARIDRQQDFIVAALNRAAAKGARNPSTLNQLINAGLDSVVVDERLTPNQILELGDQFSSFQAEDLAKYTLPVMDDVVGGAQVLQLVTSEAQPVLDVFRGVSPAAAPVLVRVLNGTGEGGVAAQVAAELTDVGFVVSERGDAENFAFEESVVRYAPGEEVAAAELAGWVEARPALEADLALGGDEVVLVIGADFTGLRETPVPPDVPPGPDPAPPAATVEAAPDAAAEPTPESGATPTPTPTPPPAPRCT